MSLLSRHTCHSYIWKQWSSAAGTVLLNLLNCTEETGAGGPWQTDRPTSLPPISLISSLNCSPHPLLILWVGLILFLLRLSENRLTGSLITVTLSLLHISAVTGVHTGAHVSGSGLLWGAQVLLNRSPPAHCHHHQLQEILLAWQILSIGNFFLT